MIATNSKPPKTTNKPKARVAGSASIIPVVIIFLSLSLVIAWPNCGGRQ
jgi:hypothetical protein